MAGFRDTLNELLHHSPSRPPSADPERGFDADADRYRELAEAASLPFAEAGELLDLLDLEVAHTLDRSKLEKHRAIPVAILDGRLVVASDATSPPPPKWKRRFGVDFVDPRVVTPTGFRRLLWAIDFGEMRMTGSAVDGSREEPDDILLHDPRVEAESIAVWDSILLDAVEIRASDIHLENDPDGVRIRMRVDGDLRVCARYDLDKAQIATLVRLMKVRSGLDIAEHRLAQGGQLKTRVAGHPYFVRVQTQPTIHGENLALRLLPQDTSLQSLEKLGFSGQSQKYFERLLQSPGGMVLVVGPTGSGKTTTLYAGLRRLAADTRRKVISIEDPVEYVCEGIQQVSTCEAAGFGFARAMRSFVREDPDVILLGEVRDPETALEAIRASQTGHLVLSTLHCNDAVDAVQRLLDLGTLPNSLSSELLAVFAQRLARRICEHCREPSRPDPAVAAEIFPDGLPQDFESFAGRGCERCDRVGVRGRIAVIESLRVSPELRLAISTGANLEDLRRIARETGLVSLRSRALELVNQGLIAFDELPRFIPIDRLGPPSR